MFGALFVAFGGLGFRVLGLSVCRCDLYRSLNSRHEVASKARALVLSFMVYGLG